MCYNIGYFKGRPYPTKSFDKFSTRNNNIGFFKGLLCPTNCLCAHKQILLNQSEIRVKLKQIRNLITLFRLIATTCNNAHEKIGKILVYDHMILI